MKINPRIENFFLSRCVEQKGKKMRADEYTHTHIHIYTLESQPSSIRNSAPESLKYPPAVAVFDTNSIHQLCACICTLGVKLTILQLEAQDDPRQPKGIREPVFLVQ